MTPPALPGILTPDLPPHDRTSPLFRPTRGESPGWGPDPLHVEPGNVPLSTADRSQAWTGKVVVDLRNRNVWGFPSLCIAVAPPPSTLPVSRHFLMGRLAVEDIEEK